MIILIYGTDRFLIHKECENIAKKSKIDSFGINQLDLEITPLAMVLEDASMPSLFGDKKMIICENSYIFTGVNKK